MQQIENKTCETRIGFSFSKHHGVQRKNVGDINRAQPELTDVLSDKKDLKKMSLWISSAEKIGKIPSPSHNRASIIDLEYQKNGQYARE